MHKTTLYLEEELYERVRRLAEARGVTQAAVIREAIAKYAGGGELPWPRSVGSANSGSSEAGDRAEELLTGFGEDE